MKDAKKRSSRQLPNPARTSTAESKVSSKEFKTWMPDAGDQLESAEVQQYGARISQGPNGLEFATRATWVLSVDDRQAAAS